MGLSFYNKVRLEDITRTQSPVASLKESRSDEQETAGSNPQLDHQPLTLLSPNSDQQQFSPNNVYTLSKDKVVRI